MATCLLSGTRVFPPTGMQRASSMARSQAIYLRPALTMHKNDPSQPLSPRALHHVHGSAHYRWPNAHSISCASHRNNAEITPLPQLPDGDPESRRNCGRAVRVLSCETLASTLPVPTCGIPESPHEGRCRRYLSTRHPSLHPRYCHTPGRWLHRSLPLGNLPSQRPGPSRLLAPSRPSVGAHSSRLVVRSRPA